MQVHLAPVGSFIRRRGGRFRFQFDASLLAYLSGDAQAVCPSTLQQHLKPRTNRDLYFDHASVSSCPTVTAFILRSRAATTARPVHQSSEWPMHWNNLYLPLLQQVAQVVNDCRSSWTSCFQTHSNRVHIIRRKGGRQAAPLPHLQHPSHHPHQPTVHTSSRNTQEPSPNPMHPQALMQHKVPSSCGHPVLQPLRMPCMHQLQHQ